MTAQHTTQSFIHDGKTYELRLQSDGWTFTVKAFLNGQPANGYSHSVTLPTAFDLRNTKGCDAIEILFEDAKSDIRDGTWDRLVEALNALHLTEDQSIGCRKCTSREVEIKTVDDRKMYRCKSCNNVWYEKRTVGGAYEMTLDDITEGVIAKGSYELHIAFLLNMNFREEAGRPSFWDQLQNWCNQNHLAYQVFYKQIKRGKDEQWLRFTRNIRAQKPSPTSPT